jgi:hypothetical protein
MSQMNPYQAPRAQVADPAANVLGTFIEGGRPVEAGHGWSWIASGFDIFKASIGAWIVIAIILAVIFFGLNIVPIVGGLAAVILMPVFAGGIMLGCQAAARDGNIAIGHLFAGFSRNTGSLVVLGVIGLAASIVLMIPLFIVMGGTFFALMKGDPNAAAAIGAMGAGVAIAFLLMFGLSILIYMALWFAPALVVFHDAPPMDAVRQSFGACLKNIVPFLVYGIVMFVLAVIATIPLGLGLLVLVPMGLASIYTAYRDIFFAEA